MSLTACGRIGFDSPEDARDSSLGLDSLGLDSLGLDAQGLDASGSDAASNDADGGFPGDGGFGVDGGAGDADGGTSVCGTTSGLRAYLPLDSPIVGGMTSDPLHPGRPATCGVDIECPTFENIDGRDSLRFSSTTQTCLRVDNVDLTEGFSVLGYARISPDASSVQAIWAKAFGTEEGNSFQIRFPDSLAFEFVSDDFAGGRNTISMAGGVDANVWTHVASSWSPIDGRKTLYIDGVLVDEALDVVIGFDDRSVYLGCDDDPSGFDNFFDGWLSKFRLYDRVLDPGEIVTLQDCEP